MRKYRNIMSKILILCSLIIISVPVIHASEPLQQLNTPMALGGSTEAREAYQSLLGYLDRYENTDQALIADITGNFHPSVTSVTYKDEELPQLSRNEKLIEYIYPISSDSANHKKSDSAISLLFYGNALISVALSTSQADEAQALETDELDQLINQGTLDAFNHRQPPILVQGVLRHEGAIYHHVAIAGKDAVQYLTYQGDRLVAHERTKRGQFERRRDWLLHSIGQLANEFKQSS